MLPLVRIAAARKELTLTDAAESLAQEFSLSPADRAEMLPSGRQKRFNNRIGWAVTHLRKAGVLDYPGRGRMRITPRGQELLRTAPDSINLRLLMQYPEFVAFRQSSVTPESAAPNAPPDDQPAHSPGAQRRVHHDFDLLEGGSGLRA